MRMLAVLLLVLALPAEARKPKGPPTPPEPPIPIVNEAEPMAATPGSLFDDVRARRLMGMDGYARQVGDLVTVRILESSRTSLAASTNTGKRSNYRAAIRALLGVEQRILRAAQDLNELGIDVSTEAEFAGSGDTSRDSELEAVITCQVIDVLDGGNLRVWGWKQVRVNEETQYVVLDGIARPRDIRIDNTVSSDLLASARIEISGQGVVNGANRKGWFLRVLDALWPF